MISNETRSILIFVGIVAYLFFSDAFLMFSFNAKLKKKFIPIHAGIVGVLVGTLLFFSHPPLVAVAGGVLTFIVALPSLLYMYKFCVVCGATTRRSNLFVSLDNCSSCGEILDD